MSGYQHPEVLVSTDWVAQNLGKARIRLVEVDVDTKAYEAGHIPGALPFAAPEIEARAAEIQRLEEVRRSVKAEIVRYEAPGTSLIPIRHVKRG